MQPRRRRERSTLSEWPALSLLAVYRDTPILAGPDASRKLDDAALEAAKVLVFAAPLEREPPNAARRNRIMGTVLGVAAFARSVCAYVCAGRTTADGEVGERAKQDTGTAGSTASARSALVEAQNGLGRGGTRLLRPRRA